jgi:hypothetical protein
MPDNSQLFGLLGLGKGGGKGGGGHHHHGGRGRFRGGGGFYGPGYYWGDPILVAEDVSTIIPQQPAANGAPKLGAKVYADAIAMKTRAEHGDTSLHEVWNGQDKQILHEPDLPKAAEGFMWVFHSGPSRRTGAPGNWIMYVRSGRK